MKGEKLLEAYKEADEKIEKIFDRKGVLLAYVFGSVANENVGPLSDIDFAVYFKDSLSKGQRRELYLDILNDLIEVLGDEIDLVTMNDASLLLNFNIIRSGEIVFKRSEDDRIHIESEIMRRNLDMEYYRERHADTKIKRIAQRGLK